MSDLSSSTPDTSVQSFTLAELQRAALDNLPIAVSIYEIVSRTRFRMVLINHAVMVTGGNANAQVTEADVVGKFMDELIPPATAAQILPRLHACIDTGEAVTVEDSYYIEELGTIWTRSRFAPMPQPDGRITHILVTWEDVTAQKQREQAEQQQQENLIQQQQAQLAELSTPLLTISATTVVMPLVGAIDSRRVQQIMQTLLEGVTDSHATLVILDITGVPIVDTQVANALIHTSQAVRLLGAQVVLTGIRPEVAQTLVGLGVNLRSVITRGTLRDGIEYALHH